MKLLRQTLAIAAVALVGSLSVPVVHGQDMNPNKKTYFTFSAPVEVPGATLQPGKYLFQLADLQSNRHVVQIFNEDGTKLIVTTLTVADQRLEPKGDPVVVFLETPAGTPAAIKSWFYPGDLIGDEFIYPKDQAMRIAKATNTSVLSADTIAGDGIEGMRTAEIGRVNAEGERSTAVAKAEPSPTTPEPEVVPPPAPVPPARVTARDETPQPVGTSGTTPARRLPNTASEAPLIGLIGVLALAAAASIRAHAKYHF